MIEGQRCGRCIYFDRNRVDGTFFGASKSNSGEVVFQGVCRASRGLVLGILNEETPCKQLISQERKEAVVFQSSRVLPPAVL